LTPRRGRAIVARMSEVLPSLADLERAAARLGDRVHRTPLLSSRTLGDATGACVWLKCENLQRSGSFKIRGALNACTASIEAGEAGEAGFLTYSSGNHGQAVALAARLLGRRAVVVVPEDIPPVKRAAIEGYGAEIVVCGRTSSERGERAREIERSTGARMIEPFDHPHTIAGQGTTGLEILEQVDGPITVLVPVGGGGLLAGIAIACATRGEHRANVIGVEPETADAMHRSLAAGRVVALEQPPATIADGLKPVAPGALTFAAARAHVDRVIRVPDDAIRRAQRSLLERAKLLVEPSGAATTAALLENPAQFAGRTVVVVLSGGNTEPASIYA